MKNRNLKGKKLLKKVAVVMLDKDPREWPPNCIGFAYQPMRPTERIAKKEVAFHK